MKGSGLTIQVPVVDLMEIGAGGGSIAKISKLGTLQVGPESSGAAPGPICYGRGGTEPCVTDADLLLGYLDENYFLGGEMKLDKEGARRGVEEKIAKPLGVSFIQAVWGIHDLINETMAAAAKTHIAEKGGNPKIVTIVGLRRCRTGSRLWSGQETGGPPFAGSAQCRSRFGHGFFHRSQGL